MTEAQIKSLTSLCERYGVNFDPQDYQPQFDLPKGYVAGWVGGVILDRPMSTLYVGVSAEGEVSS